MKCNRLKLGVIGQNPQCFPSVVGPRCTSLVRVVAVEEGPETALANRMPSGSPKSQGH